MTSDGDDLQLLVAKREDTITFRLPDLLGAWLRLHAGQKNMSRSELVFSLCVEYYRSVANTRTRSVHQNPVYVAIERSIAGAQKELGEALEMVRRSSQEMLVARGDREEQKGKKRA